jgi:hypothetical protein
MKGNVNLVDNFPLLLSAAKITMQLSSLLVAIIVSSAYGFLPAPVSVKSSVSLRALDSRRAFMVNGASAAFATLAVPSLSFADSGEVEVNKLKNGSGPTPSVSLCC